MNKLIVVLIFSLALQNMSGSYVGGLIRNVVDFAGNVQTAVTDRLLGLKNLVHSLVESGVDRVEKVANDVVDTGLGVRLGCIHLIQTGAEEAQKLVTSMVEDSLKDGKDASHCVRSITSDSIENIGNQVTSCIEENVLQCRKYVTEGIERIRDFLHISEKFDNDIRDCGVGVLSAPCIGLLVPKIIAESALVSTKVGQLITDVIGYLLLFTGKFAACQTLALATSSAEFGKFVTDAGSCIEKLARTNIKAVISDYIMGTTTTEVTNGVTTEYNVVSNTEIMSLDDY